jgi:hypothetical protein
LHIVPGEIERAGGRLANHVPIRRELNPGDVEPLVARRGCRKGDVGPGGVGSRWLCASNTLS